MNWLEQQHGSALFGHFGLDLGIRTIWSWTIRTLWSWTISCGPNLKKSCHCTCLVLSDYTSYCSSLGATLEALWTKRGWAVQTTDLDVPLLLQQVWALLTCLGIALLVHGINSFKWLWTTESYMSTSICSLKEAWGQGFWKNQNLYVSIRSTNRSAGFRPIDRNISQETIYYFV